MKPEFINLFNCPICESNKLNTANEICDYSVSQEVFKLTQCENCKFLFTNPIPHPDSLGKYYAGSEYISHGKSKGGLFPLVYKLIRSLTIRSKIKLINKIKPNAKIILDYGSGTGEFLNACSKKGFNTIGVELSEEPRNASVIKYNLDVRHPEELKLLQEKQFEVITMWHVLEHLPELRHTLEGIINKLAEGGVLVLALPNHESFDAQYYGNYWAAWDVPIHLYHFVKEDIHRLAEQFNLEVVDIKNMPFDSFYVSLLSEQYKNGKKNWLTAFYIGLLSNIKTWGKKNASSLTYILRKL